MNDMQEQFERGAVAYFKRFIETRSVDKAFEAAVEDLGSPTIGEYNGMCRAWQWYYSVFVPQNSLNYVETTVSKAEHVILRECFFRATPLIPMRIRI